jgi:AAHS family 4-hydroxybenzoate transporter-like MFS transporter
MPLGSFIGGMIGRAVVPDFGWQMLLYVGGGLTLGLTLLAAWVLPESVHFLLHIRKDPDRAAAAARRLIPQMPSGRLVIDETERAVEPKQPLTRLFSGGFWQFTLLISVAYIVNQGILYFVLSWTPALLQKSGLTSTAGMDAAAMFGLGGALGTALQGWLATRFNLYKLMFVEMALYLVAILALPNILDNAWLAPATVFFIAAGICAYHAGFILIVVESYPNDIRTTGFGWALGIGRIGATGSPVLAGALVGLGWSPGQIFAAAAVPGLVSVVTLAAIVSLLRRRQRTGGQAPFGLGPAAIDRPVAVSR